MVISGWEGKDSFQPQRASRSFPATKCKPDYRCMISNTVTWIYWLYYYWAGLQYTDSGSHSELSRVSDWF